MSVLRWHEDSLQRDDPSIIPEARLPWMPPLGTELSSAPSPELQAGVAHNPEVALVRSLEREEALAELLLSIQGTALSRCLEGVVTPVRRPPQAVRFTTSAEDVAFAKLPPRPIPLRRPPPTKLVHTRLVLTPPYAGSVRLMPSSADSCLPLTFLAPKADDTRPGPEGDVSAVPATRLQQPSGPVVLREAFAAKPAPLFLVQTPSHSARVLPMPPPGASSRRRTKVAVMPETASSLPGGAARQPLMLESAGVDKPAVTILSLHPPASAKGGASIATIPAALSDGVNRLGQKVTFTVERTGQVRKKLSTGFKNWIETSAAPAIQRAGQACAALAIEIKGGLKNTSAFTIKSTRAAMIQSSNGLRHGFKTGSAVTATLIDHANKRLSTWHENWTDSRSSARLREPPLVAYCWTADTPDSLKIADISSGGVYLLTDARWPRGSTISMTLQRTDKGKQAPGSWLVIDFMVIRWCQDGLAGAFIPPTPYSASRWAENYADPKTLKNFVKQLAAPARA
jgi:hypothetical protein